MPQVEDPRIGEIQKFGYPKDMYEDQHCGTDYFGTEIVEGDEIFELDGETVLAENLERFLVEFAGGKFTLAK